MKTNKRKVIIVLLEGTSDKRALSLIEKFYKEKNIKLYVFNGDITSDYHTTDSNCIKKINAKIKEFINKEKIKLNDIYEIIHLTDTDGTFIPDNCIVVDKTLDEFFYTLEHIKAKNKQKVIDRNNKKCTVIKKLQKTVFINKIKYRIFFMSCNLDHVLYDNINLENDKKVKRAFEFREKYENDKIGFINFFNSKEIKVNGNYDETWGFIQNSKNSLNRWNNFWIFINELEL